MPGLTAHGLNDADRLGMPPQDSPAKDYARTVRTCSAVRARRAREPTLRKPGLTRDRLTLFFATMIGVEAEYIGGGNFLSVSQVASLISD